MRFKGLDLNLLVALDVLLTERNISRAAEKLCLSQSATSGALARLRDYFGDELLIQVGRKMVPTLRAVALADRVRNVLLQVDGTIIRPPAFDLAVEKRTINIIASDYVAIVALKDALQKLNALAPNLSFVIEPPQHQPVERIERGEADFLVMPDVYLSQDHPSELLFTDAYCVVCDRDNPAYGDAITEEEFFKARHVVVKFPTIEPLYGAWFIKNRGNERKVAAVVGSFSAVPFMLLGTDRVTLMHTRLARVFCRMMPLRIIPLPIAIPQIRECLQWHRQSDGDGCLLWVRRQLISALKMEMAAEA